MEKWDFEPEQKNILKALNRLEAELEKSYNKPCKRKAVRCPNCMIWAAFDALKMQLY